MAAWKFGSVAGQSHLCVEKESAFSLYRGQTLFDIKKGVCLPSIVKRDTLLYASSLYRRDTLSPLCRARVSLSSRYSREALPPLYIEGACPLSLQQNGGSLIARLSNWQVVRLPLSQAARLGGGALQFGPRKKITSL